MILLWRAWDSEGFIETARHNCDKTKDALGWIIPIGVCKRRYACLQSRALHGNALPRMCAAFADENRVSQETISDIFTLLIIVSSAQVSSFRRIKVAQIGQGDGTILLLHVSAGQTLAKAVRPLEDPA